MGMISGATQRFPSVLSADSVAVLLLADHPGTRMRLAAAITDDSRLEVTSQPSADDFVAACSGYDLAVLHCAALDAADVERWGRLRAALPDLLIVAVCDAPNRRSTRRVLEGAVDGLVLMRDLEAALAPTIAAVLVGQSAVPRDLRATLRRAALSFREKQVLSLVVMGHTNHEIGQRLFLAESTVKSHLSSAFGKLGVKSRSEAAALILDPHGSLGAGILSATEAYNGIGFLPPA